MNEQLPRLPEAVDLMQAVWRGGHEFMRPVGSYYTADQMRDYARAALAANEKQPNRATDIATALALPGCERLREWADIGPVQRAAVEEFAYALADKKNEWRELALKFDGQRMAALSHLRMLLEHGEAHAEAVRKFLAEPPQAAPTPAQAQQAEMMPRHLLRALNTLLCGVSDCLTQEHGRESALLWAKECEGMLKTLRATPAPAPEAEQSFNDAKALILAMPLDDVRSYAIALLIQVRFLEKHGSMSNAVTKMKQELAPAPEAKPEAQQAEPRETFSTVQAALWKLAVERACAEAWGVKLAGIGDSGEASNA